MEVSAVIPVYNAVWFCYKLRNLLWTNLKQERYCSLKTIHPIVPSKCASCWQRSMEKFNFLWIQMLVFIIDRSIFCKEIRVIKDLITI
jgi:hypothetical protein